MMFNYDWFHQGGLTRLIDEAKIRCANKKYPPGSDSRNGKDAKQRDEFRKQLDARIILYMKDGLTYEMKEIANVGMSSALSFECVPVDDNYRVGSIVLVVPFEDIARVEVFAVHPDDKPQDNIRIGGFRSATGEVGRE
ncbi:MAG: hypothetical protein HZB38_01120 [Planctomycetes bacterium]|nr:hypothetical protein [Planctomycetota bacterium]